MTSWLDAVERTVTGMGYDLVDAERSTGGLLRVTIDHALSNTGAAPFATTPATFIHVDDCERVTRQLQYVLEVENCAYERLEVSSPGLDRPLKKAADYRRFAGESIEVTLKEPFQGRKKYRGELEAAGDGWRLLLADETPRLAPGSGKRPAKGAVRRPDESDKLDGSDKPRRALDFSLDEVRDARLVPVLDFKGRRFGAPEIDAVADAAPPDDEMDGDRIQ